MRRKWRRSGLVLATAAFSWPLLPALRRPTRSWSNCSPARVVHPAHRPIFIRLSERDDVIALSFGVTYWNYLGWDDTFARGVYAAPVEL